MGDKISDKLNDKINDNCSNVFPQVIGAVKRIIAIGDVHGDYDYLIHLLKIARVVDNDGKWIGGKTYVIQLGDQIDSCRPYYSNCVVSESTPNDKAEDTKIMDFLDDLHKEALKEDGAVISLSGNHELMNLEGDMSYVSYKNLQLHKGMDGRQKDFSLTGKYGRKIICNRPPAVIIGTNLFVHAGILPEVIDTLPEMKNILTDTIKEEIEKMTDKEVINFFVSKIISKHINKDYLLKIDANNKKFWDDIFSMKDISDKKTIKMIAENTKILHNLLDSVGDIRKYLKENIDIYGVNELHPIEVINTVIRKWLLGKINRKYLSTVEPLNAIFWNRILGSIPNEKHKNVDHATCDKYVKPVLKFLNINHMIIGHTPQFIANQSGINSACDGSLTRIDIGGANAFNMFDNNLKNKGIKMEQRIPQILEIVDDVHSRILYDEKYNKMHGGRIFNLFKNYYLSN